MKKNFLEKFKNILPLIFFIGIGVVYGMLISNFVDSKLGNTVSLGSYFLMLALMLAIVYFSFALQVIIHEAGHLICGFISRYEFVSFRLGSLMLIKLEGKLKIKFLSVLRTEGQCVMVPPERENETFPYALYNLGGSLLNFAFSALFAALYFILRGSMSLPVIFLIFAISGLAGGLMNIIPIRFSEVDNDGTNFISLKKSEDARKAFYYQCKINAELSRGIRLEDMPDNWFYMPENTALDNSLSVASAVLLANRLFDLHEFLKAEIIIDKLLSEKTAIVPIHKRLLICDKIFCLFVKKSDISEIEAYLDKGQLKFMERMKNFPSVIRTKYLIYMLRKNYIPKVQELRKFKMISEKYPYKADMESERELIGIIRAED